MEATIVRGIDRLIGQQYEVVLNGPLLPVMLPAELQTQLPLAGAAVVSGPAGVVVEFDPADPVAVFVWLRGGTDVVVVEGPDLTPDEPGDILDLDDEDEEGLGESLGADLTAVLQEDGVAEFVDEHGDAWAWDVEEARYVRTAAGSKRYGLPVGAEIKRKNNRDGWHDDAARQKRRAYYATARQRAQARHAAKQKQRERDLRALPDPELEQAMQDAIASDDMAAFDRYAAETDRRDIARGKRERRKEAAERRKAEEYERLLTAGYSDEEAVAGAYGVSVEQQRTQAAMARLRHAGYDGRGLRDLARAAFGNEVEQAFMRAEDDTNGYMVSPEGRRKNIDPRALFTGPEQRARKWASPELKEWWDTNGRPTFDGYLDSLVNGGAAAGSRDDFYR